MYSSPPKKYSPPLLLISISSHSASLSRAPHSRPWQTLTYCLSQWICLLWVFLKHCAVLCCAWAFSSCREQGLLACCGAWTPFVVDSLIVECGLSGGRASVVLSHQLSCLAACGVFADQESEPASPAWQGRFLTTEPPGKPCSGYFI